MRVWRSSAGVTLVELIVAMVIISIALLGVLAVMHFTTSRSADPMIQHQALAIAEAYLEEILLQSFDDPGGATEAGRADFDDVNDYHGLDDGGARDREGVALVGLTDYRVRVSVADENLGPSGSEVPARKIRVRVSHSAMGDVTLVGYRTAY